jgi:(p)ppGpp synthase/HD superfamily hydrolase
LKSRTLLATEGGVTDLPTLLAAILHDTVEAEHQTTKDELEEKFDPKSGTWFME